MKHLQIILWLGFSVLLLSSCISNSKTVLIQTGDFKNNEAVLLANKPPIYKLQPNDIINIDIKTLKSDNARYINRQPEGMVNITPIATYLSGYSINDSGFVFLPDVGKIKVSGLTVDEARSRIQETVREVSLADATVFITMVSFKVSVIGEVGNPGYHYVYNNQLNLLEALALAGDLSEFADRRRVNLIRQVEGGSEVVLLDLTDAEIMLSSYYYLQPNDMLYVPTLEEKNKRSNLATLAIINAAVGTITATLAIVRLIQDQRAQ
jgi:polysaccharide biosynthesis/export protein